MASSRWKRFAFFERQNLAVPDVVVEDLIPGESKTVRLQQFASQVVTLAVTTAALPVHTKPALGKVNPTAESSQVDAVTAMWSSLTACSPNTAEGDDVNNIQLPNQGQTLLSSPTVTTTTVLDGLVLVFTASLDCSRIHCFDVTVRCNPPTQQTVSDDMDGWRGYWSPFAGLQPQQEVPNESSGLVAVSACRIPGSTMFGQHRSRSNGRHAAVHSPLHVACLSSQHQLVVWEDPHLHLSCRQPVEDTTTTSDAIVYQIQQGKWNGANDGDACVLDIVPGMVAVGTHTGVVLVYAYSTAARTKQQRILRPYLRIPSPPVTGMQVVSVQLSLTTDKANVFVAYNRATSSPSASSASLNTTTAGICCYDLPLPSSQQSSQTLSAPSARHDLDGRYVGASSLVDAYPRRQGGSILTVVRTGTMRTRRYLSRVNKLNWLGLE
jgi:hypothetical protein